MHISLDGIVAGPNEEMNRIRVDEDSLLFHAKALRSKDAKLFLGVLFLILVSLRRDDN